MRKMLLAVVASGALVALMPATALAKHHGRRHHHHARIHRVHHRRIGRDPASPTTTPTTMPSAPATVTSFDSTTGVLMLTLADGSTVSGTVTSDTNLVCMSPMAGQGDDQGQDDDQGDQGGGGAGGGDLAHFDGDTGGGGDDQGQGDDDQNQSCTTANLMMGTPVQFADLSIGMAGATWDTVVLVTAPSTTPVVPDTDGDGV